MQELIELMVTNGRGYYESPMYDGSQIGSMSHLTATLAKDRLPSEQLASYFGTYDARENVTRGISEYGPWVFEGCAPLDASDRASFIDRSSSIPLSVFFGEPKE